MDITLALQRAVRGFPHGTAALAARLGMSVHTLNHKVSPTYPGAAPSVEEAADICEATGDMGALHAFAGRLDHVALAMPAPKDADDDTSLQLTATVREFSQFLGEASSGFADNRVTGAELARMEREASDAISAINKLLRMARRLHEAAKPEVEER